MMSYSHLTKPQLLETIEQLDAELRDIKQTKHNCSTEDHKSTERFSLAMRRANYGLWDWDLETDEVYYSPQWKSMLGYENEELSDNLNTWLSLIQADDKRVVLEKIHGYAEGQPDSFEVEVRMRHKRGHDVYILCRAFLAIRESDCKVVRLIGTHVDITERKKIELLNDKNSEILEMIAVGHTAPDIYNAIALMYESRHPGMRCSMLELHGSKLLHGGAPSLPKEYCDAIHGLEYGPNVGSCGASTFTGKRVLVENIETDPKWKNIKGVALPYGMRSCWSEPIKSSSGKVLGAFGMYYNHPALPNEEESNDLKSAARLAGIVMERDQTQKCIRELAYSDVLTGLSSRAHFYEHLEELINNSCRLNHRFALLYIDLDDFKSVNDSLGHDVGDLLLKTVAERLESTCRDIDFIARLGGDEFCVLVEELNNEYDAAHVAKRCLDSLGKPLELAVRKLTPACSIGIAYYPDDGADLATLIKAADTSLYSAKEKGKNQYAFYKPELTHKAEYRFQVEQYLRDAIEKHQLSLVYQPQFSISTGEIIGVEALSRWHHSLLGQVAPVDFIATAERIGMMKPLTEWVLNTACRQVADWKKDGHPSIRVAVNISPSQFVDKGIVPMVKRIIDETGVNPADLELELTEGIVQIDQANLSTFKALKRLGVRLAIDDFGKGYSSFTSLKHLEVDCLKIDKHFVGDMHLDNEALLLVGFMIDIGQKFGYRITAEGVESAAQLDTLNKLGCNAAQGYLFSKPVCGKEISNLRNKTMLH